MISYTTLKKNLCPQKNEKASHRVGKNIYNMYNQQKTNIQNKQITIANTEKSEGKKKFPLVI